MVANISDFMLEMIEVNFSIVYSIIRDGIKLSIRSNPAFYDAGLVTLHALKGIGTGGGHSTMAGAFIPFKHWDEYELLDKIENNRLFYENDYRNIIIKYFNDIDITSEDIDALENVDYRHCKELFYYIPIIIFCLESTVKTILNKKE